MRSSNPVIACLASQYAGWSLPQGRQGRLLRARLRPGARARAGRAAVRRARLSQTAPRPPPWSWKAAVRRRRAGRQGRRRLPASSPTGLTFIYAPTQSLAGAVQVVARVLEVALHKAHELSFPLERIVDGSAPRRSRPPHPDFVTAMGRTNDAIIYARPGAPVRDAARQATRARLAKRCRARPRATTASRSRRSSSASRATSTPSIRCCSARRR